MNLIIPSLDPVLDGERMRELVAVVGRIILRHLFHAALDQAFLETHGAVPAPLVLKDVFQCVADGKDPRREGLDGLGRNSKADQT